MIPVFLFAEEAGKTPAEPSNSQSNFILTVKDNLISLSAKDASFKELLEEIGRRMNIEVFANIPREQKLTLEFDSLSIEDAIRELRKYASIVYVKDAKKEPEQIRKIIALPIQAGARVGAPASSVREEALSQQAPRPKPFKFEFDPSQYEKKPQ
jgi:hypothetical protein